MNIQDEIEQAFHEWWNSPVDGENISDYMMPLVRKAQAEALREAVRIFAEGGWVDTFIEESVQDDASAVIATDKWFNEYADRIEQNSEGNGDE